MQLLAWSMRQGGELLCSRLKIQALKQCFSLEFWKFYTLHTPASHEPARPSAVVQEPVRASQAPEDWLHDWQGPLQLVAGSQRACAKHGCA